jgi:hypothetical protein
VVSEGPPKKRKRKQARKKNLAKSDRPTFPFFPLFFSFFSVPLLGAMRVGCGHATADGHPQLAAGSSFAS